MIEAEIQVSKDAISVKRYPKGADLTGEKFGRLTVIQKAASDSRPRWKCVCECGTETVVEATNLRSGHTKSCGCFQAQRRSESHTTHGLGKPPEYKSWTEMRQRCLNPSNHAYINYGGRGIKISPEWVDDFAAFLRHVGPRPSPKHSIDRYPDNDGNYEPGNVRWATAKQQGRNKRNNRRITALGKTLTISEWAEELSVPSRMIRVRLNKGWAEEKAIIQPPRYLKK